MYQKRQRQLSSVNWTNSEKTELGFDFKLHPYIVTEVECDVHATSRYGNLECTHIHYNVLRFDEELDDYLPCETPIEIKEELETWIKDEAFEEKYSGMFWAHPSDPD